MKENKCEEIQKISGATSPTFMVNEEGQQTGKMKTLATLEVLVTNFIGIPNPFGFWPSLEKKCERRL